MRSVRVTVNTQLPTDLEPCEQDTNESLKRTTTSTTTMGEAARVGVSTAAYNHHQRDDDNTTTEERAILSFIHHTPPHSFMCGRFTGASVSAPSQVQAEHSFSELLCNPEVTLCVCVYVQRISVHVSCSSLPLLRRVCVNDGDNVTIMCILGTALRVFSKREERPLRCNINSYKYHLHFRFA